MVSYSSTGFILRIAVIIFVCSPFLILWGETQVLDRLENEQRANSHISALVGGLYRDYRQHEGMHEIIPGYVSKTKEFGKEEKQSHLSEVHHNERSSQAIADDHNVAKKSVTVKHHRNRKKAIESENEFNQYPQRDRIKTGENYVEKLYTVGNIPNDEQIAFDIAKLRYHEQQQQQFQVTNETRYSLEGYNFGGRMFGRGTRKLNMIRIPKAGSSYLSITGRALAGCKPDGFPCCQQPYDDCPFNTTQCGALHGCLDHRPSYSGNTPTITQLREPSSRLLSGFFYGTGTHNDNDGCYKWTCFESYIEDRRFRNVLTKILEGISPYTSSGEESIKRMVKPAKQQLCKMAWFGMLEMPIASHLLLYESGIFTTIFPNPVVFDLPPMDDVDNAKFWNQTQHHNDKRGRNEWKTYIRDSEGNKNKQKYDKFVKGEYQKKNGIALIKSFNKEDYDVYNFAVDLFCARLRDIGLTHLASQFNEKGHFDRCLNVSWTGSGEDLCLTVAN